MGGKNNRKTHLRIIQQGRQWVESKITGCNPIVGLEMDLVSSSRHLKIENRKEYITHNERKFRLVTFRYIRIAIYVYVYLYIIRYTLDQKWSRTIGAWVNILFCSVRSSKYHVVHESGHLFVCFTLFHSHLTRLRLQ